MIATHPLRKVVLGGTSSPIQIDQVDLRGIVGLEPLQVDSPIVTWLRSSIPDLDLRLTKEDYSPPEFYGEEWRLW